MKNLILPTLVLAITGCGTSQQLAVVDQRVPNSISGGATHLMTAAPLTVSEGMLTQSVTHSLLSRATPVAPFRLDTGSTSSQVALAGQSMYVSGGYSIPFYDLNGYSFAYLTFVNRNGGSDPAEILRSAEGNQSSEMHQWQTATYASGANNARDVISYVAQGVEILKTLHGEEGRRAGLNTRNIVAYVMPNGETFWVRLSDGRYFDLKQRKFVSTDEYQRAAQDYARLTDIVMDHASVVIPRLQSSWEDVQRPRRLAQSKTQSSGELSAQAWRYTAGVECFLWHCWDALRPASYEGSITWNASQYSEYQLQLPNGMLQGCGPVSVAVALQWYRDNRKDNRNKNALLDNSRDITANTLMGYMGSFRAPNGETATSPGGFIDGANAYLRDNSLGSQMIGTYGAPAASWPYQFQFYSEAMQRDEPFIGLYFSNSVQHFGIVDAVSKAPGDVVLMRYPSLRNAWLVSSTTWNAYSTGAYRLVMP